jgi:hypothetical protein
VNIHHYRRLSNGEADDDAYKARRQREAERANRKVEEIRKADEERIPALAEQDDAPLEAKAAGRSEE